MAFEDGREGLGADLLLTLYEDSHPDGQLPGVRPEGRDMGHDASLIVRRASTVQPAVAFGRLEWRTVPITFVPRRLHIMVRIEHHGRCTGWAIDVRDHRRAPALANDLNL